MESHRNRTHTSLLKELKTVVAATILGVLLVTACARKDESAQKKPATSPPADIAELLPLSQDSIPGWAIAGVAGISWRIPAGWVVGPQMPMRAGTYFASATGGDAEPAECRVNFFGSGQGGGVDENIARWIGQMEIEGQEGSNPSPTVTSASINDISLTLVELSGVYLSRTRPMAREFTRKPGFKMFAAIASAPEGTVFFKMTGPEKTMEANRESFRLMMGSIAPGK